MTRADPPPQQRAPLRPQQAVQQAAKQEANQEAPHAAPAGATAAAGAEARGAGLGAPSRAAAAVPETPLALQARDLGLQLNGRTVLAGVHLGLRAGRWTCVVGPNGAGKSSLLKALAGLLPANGAIHLLGRPLHDWPAAERARALAWMGQNEGASDDLGVADVVLLGRLPHRAWWLAPGPADHAAAQQAMAQAGCLDLRERRMGTLSGGERQRVLLARALAVQAPLLLLDEPLAHLDPPHQADWLRLVRATVARGGTVVSVLHELHLALQADDLLLLVQGRVFHHGAAADPTTHRALEQAFEQRVTVAALDQHWVALPRL